MARRTKINEYPFTSGEHQEIDGKILPDGFLTRAKNVRLRKDGRFGVRADFDALGNDTANVTDIVPLDLLPDDESLLAVAATGFGAAVPADLAQYVGTAPIDWRTTIQDGSALRIGHASSMRELLAVPSVAALRFADVSRIDCAAAGGYVALALQATGSAGEIFIFHVMRAETGATVTSISDAGINPRVVAVGTKFFFTFLNTAATTLSQRSFDPAVDAAIQTLSDLHSGTAVNCYDARTDFAGTGYWVAFNLATPTTSIVPVNSSGTAGTAIVGPAVTYQHLAVCQTSTRVHLLTVIAAGAIQLRSYTTGGALSTGPTTLNATSDDRQPGLKDATTGGTELVLTLFQRPIAPFVAVVTMDTRNALTHANAAGINVSVGSYLGSKPAGGGATNQLFFCALLRPDGDFLTHAIASSATGGGDGDIYAYKDRFAAAASSAAVTPQIGEDASTGKLYWANLYIGPDGNRSAYVTELSFASAARRQAAMMAGLLYIAGGAMRIFDGKRLQQYFYDKPQIISATPSNGAGTLPSNTTLLVAVVFERVDRRGNLWQSDVSLVESVTMGATDDTITLSIVPPLGIAEFGTATTVVAYRSITGINQLRRAGSTLFQTTAPITITLTDPDSTVRTQGVIYTQAGRGILSGTLPHEAALPCDYVWKFGARLLCASADRAFVSKEVFPGEPVNFSGDVGFSIPSIPERIVGVAALDLRGFLFTSERIYWFFGDGPNDNGEGRYSEPTALPGSTGLTDWRSLVETPLGIMFQGSNGQIWLLPRDGSAPVWIGEPVRDTLVSYPVVTSATLVTEEQLVSFTCNNAGETDSRIVNYDLRAKAWIVDEFASATPIRAACSYQGRLAFISAGVVYVEKTSLTPATFIEHGLTTGTVNEFGSGWGKHVAAGVVGEYRGDCNVRARISYDDGKTFTNMAEFQLRAANGLTAGDTIELEWAPARRKAQGIRLDFQARTPGSASEGFVFNNWWTETQQTGGGPRKRASERG